MSDALSDSYPLLFSDMPKTFVHRRLMIKAIAREVKKEMQVILSDSNTVFCDKKIELRNFSWSRMWDELMKRAPLLMNVVSSGGAPRGEQANAVPCSQHVSEEEEQIFGIGAEMHFCISLWKCMQ